MRLVARDPANEHILMLVLSTQRPRGLMAWTPATWPDVATRLYTPCRLGCHVWLCGLPPVNRNLPHAERWQTHSPMRPSAKLNNVHSKLSKPPHPQFYPVDRSHFRLAWRPSAACRPTPFYHLPTVQVSRVDRNLAHTKRADCQPSAVCRPKAAEPIHDECITQRPRGLMVNELLYWTPATCTFTPPAGWAENPPSGRASCQR